MEKESLQFIFDVLNDKYESTNKIIADYYDDLNEQLNIIKDSEFPDLNNGKLIIFPFGDYLTNTFYEGSLIEFYIIYQTNRDNINFAVIYEKPSKNGKKRVSTYQQIMGGAINKNVMQAEDIAERFAFYLQKHLTQGQRLYQKRNQIYMSLKQGLTARINVVYDFYNENNNLKMRRINKWTDINLLNYFENIDKKNEETNGNFSRFVTLLKALELELLIAEESNIIIGKNSFVENFLYNIPSQLFNYEDIVVLNNIINFIKNKNYNSYELIDGTGKMFSDNLIYSKNYAKQFINKINYACANFEKILKTTSSRE